MTAAPPMKPPPGPPRTRPPGPPPPNGTAAPPAATTGPRPRLGILPARKVGRRFVLNGVEGWGKTSAPAFASNPAIIQVGTETGYETLRNAGLVPNIPAATALQWKDLLDLVDDVAAGGGVEILALDAMGGMERLCHEFVCNRDFEGKWGERGFNSYQKGYDVAVTDWLDLLARLDKAKDAGIDILLLSHAKVTTFKNPAGPDYDKYVADCHGKTWAATHRWADAVLFGKFFTVVEGGALPVGTRPGRKGKGIGGTQRIVYCEQRDAWDAKNRFGMPSEINIPDDPAATWQTILDSIGTNKKGGDAQ